MISNEVLRQFLLYSSSLVEIWNIPSPLVLFLEFEQPFIEKFWPYHFQKEKSSGLNYSR